MTLEFATLVFLTLLVWWCDIGEPRKRAPSLLDLPKNTRVRR